MVQDVCIKEFCSGGCSMCCEREHCFGCAYCLAEKIMNTVYDKLHGQFKNRKHDGLCTECGDEGEIKVMACFCRKGHGKIWG